MKFRNFEKNEKFQICVDLRILVQMIQENVRLKAEIVKF